MKCFTQYRRELADTVNGEKIIVTTIYSSFDKEEIDNLEEQLKEKIQSGLIYELKRRTNDKYNR